MKITALTENGRKTGRWFDIDKADGFKEDTFWNGNNHISKATGSQWEHEYLFLTKGGVFVLHSFSDYQGSIESYEIISKEEAARWFVKNEYNQSDIPDIFRAAIAELEVE